MAILTPTIQREVCFDTETTGLSPAQGHRVIELACVEVVDFVPTGNEFHVYIDPERDVPLESTRVHGLTREMLRGKPKFREIARDFLAFIGDAPLVAHNAAFDMDFVNAELKRAGLPPLANRSIDTVSLAKRAFPGAKVNLDDLCRRFGIDLSSRTKHGALIDTRLLARVYMELNGGRERTLAFADPAEEAAVTIAAAMAQRPVRPARPLGAPAEAEIALHAAFVKGLKNPLWLRAEQAAEAPAPGL